MDNSKDRHRAELYFEYGTTVTIERDSYRNYEAFSTEIKVLALSIQKMWGCKIQHINLFNADAVARLREEK